VVPESCEVSLARHTDANIVGDVVGTISGATIIACSGG
jgi:hypothetical protein